MSEPDRRKALLGLVNRAREFDLISLPRELPRFRNSENVEVPVASTT
jgi:hypothetical protein